MTTLPRCLVLSTVLALATGTVAQGPPGFVDLHLPAGVLATGVTASGKLVLYREGNFLHVFSAVTNQWHAFSLSFGTSTVLKRDMLLVPESDRWTAFSAYRGVFATQMVPYAASTIQHDDSVACVTHGSTLHTFSAFTGRWSTRQIPAGWFLLLGSRVALLQTPTVGANLAASAFDAFTDSWYDIPPQPLGVFGFRLAGGTVVVATTQRLFGFSPLRPGWVQQPNALPWPFPYIAPTYSESELVGMIGHVFSGISGTFAAPPVLPPNGVFNVTQNVASFSEGSNQRFALGAGSNTWIPLPNGLVVGAGTNVVVAYGSGQLHAFSPLTDTVAATPWTQGPISLLHNGVNVVTVYDASTGARPAFSAFTGTWYSPPAGTLPELAWTARNSALYRTTTGLLAFAAPSGAFVPLTGANLTRINGYTASDATTLHVFDAHGARWLSHPRQAGTGIGPLFGERTLVATDPNWLLAFSPRGRRLVSAPPPEVVAEAQANEDVAFVRTASHVLAFSGLSETIGWQDAPDGIYGAGLGATATVQARVPDAHFVLMGFGPPLAAPIPLPPYGELWLDLASTVILALGSAAGETRAVVPVAIPNVAALRGSTWLQQAMTLSPGGAIWLGMPSTLRVQ